MTNVDFHCADLFHNLRWNSCLTDDRLASSLNPIHSGGFLVSAQVTTQTQHLKVRKLFLQVTQ